MVIIWFWSLSASRWKVNIRSFHITLFGAGASEHILIYLDENVGHLPHINWYWDIYWLRRQLRNNLPQFVWNWGSWETICLSSLGKIFLICSWGTFCLTYLGIEEVEDQYGSSLTWVWFQRHAFSTSEFSHVWINTNSYIVTVKSKH